jgi:hypothetical protein
MVGDLDSTLATAARNRDGCVVADADLRNNPTTAMNGSTNARRTWRVSLHPVIRDAKLSMVPALHQAVRKVPQAAPTR